MLGALALLAVSIWLIRKGVNAWFTILPMIFMFILTVSALGVLIFENLFTAGEPNYFLASASFVLLVLCVFLLIEGWNAFAKTKKKDDSIKVS